MAFDLISELSNDPRKYFYTAAEGVGVAWTELACILNKSIDVDVIAAEKRQVFDRAITALHKWYCMEGTSATTERLLQALDEIGKHNVVEDILK